MNDIGEKTARSGHGRFLISLYIVSFAAIAFFAVDGFSFYSTPYGQRPRHDRYSDLRPAGARGHGFGIVGSTMMIFMLLYSLRKRTRFFGTIGKLRNWLNIHIYFGIIGPTLVILHTSFKVQGLVMVSFWSMIAVALSGVFGRYLYLQIPRDLQGESLTLQDLDAMSGELSMRLKEEGVLTEEEISKLENELAPAAGGTGGIISSLWLLLLDDIIRPFKTRRIKKRYFAGMKISPRVRDEIMSTAMKKALLKRKIALFNQIQQLFHYWHVFHKPFAIIMYLIMVVHVTVAVWLGYVWVF